MSALPELANGAPGESPFLLLNFYEQKDAYRFAGRDDEINAVVTGVLSFDTFVLYGRSGLGKTSLLLAGVFPELEKRGFKPVYSRVLDLPVAELRKKIDAEIAAQTGSIILVLDQFEEFFIRVREENENQPARRLAACREMAAMLADVQRRSAGRVRLLFSIREDYYAELDDFRSEMPAIAAHGFRLLPVTAYGARRAIILMLEYAHPPVAYDQKFLSLLLDEVARTGFDPLLLQIMCVEVWRDANAKRPGTNELRAEDFENVGGFEQIFQRYVERAAAAASDPLLVRVLLDTLITAEQTKRVVRSSELVRVLYVRTKQEDIDALLRQLVELQLVRAVGRERYELLHDRLVPVVKKWLEGDKYFVDFRFAKKFIDSMATGGDFRTNSGRLISKEQMTQLIDRFALHLQLTPDEAELLFRSSIDAGDRDAIPFWASRLDEIAEDRSTTTIHEMLDSPDPCARRGAARAVRELKSGRTFVPKLLDMVVNDFTEVSEAAAKSFAGLASDEDLAGLRPEMKNRRLRSTLTALVVECYDQHRPTHVFPWQIRRRAWLAVRARNAATEGELIRRAVVTGSLRGTFAGALWALTIGSLVFAIKRWNTDASNVLDGVWAETLITLIVVAIVGAAAGVLIGWSASRRAARRDTVARFELWYGGPTRGITQSLVLFVVALALCGTLDLNASAPSFALAGIAVGAVIALVMLAVIAFRRPEEAQALSGAVWLRLHRAWPWIAVLLLCGFLFFLHGSGDPDRAFNSLFTSIGIIAILSAPAASLVLRLRNGCRAEGFGANLFWTLIATGGVALLGAIAAIALYENIAEWKLGRPILLAFLVTPILFALTVSLGAMRAAVIGSATDHITKAPLAGPRVRALSRSIAGACLFLAIGGYLWLFGVASVPWLAKTRSVNAAIRDDLLRNVVNTHYYEIRGISDATRLVSLHYPADNWIVMTSGERYSHAPDRLTFASQPFTMGVTRTVADAKSPYEILVKGYPLRAGSYERQDVIVADLLPQGERWLVSSPKAFEYWAPTVVWDPQGQRAYYLAKAYNGKEGIDVRPLEKPLLLLESTWQFQQSEPIPNPPDFKGSRLQLVARKAGG